MPRLKSALFYNFISQVLVIGFPLFLNVYLVRVLDFEDLGKWYLVNSAVALVQLLVTAPHFWLVRQISSGKDRLRQTVSAGVITYLLVLLAVGPIYFGYIVWAAPTAQFVAVAVFVHVLFSTLACDYYFQAVLKQRFLMIRRIVSRSFLMLLLVIFVQEPDNFETFIFLVTGAYIAESLVGFVVVWKDLGLTLPGKATIIAALSSLKEMLPFNAFHNTLPHIMLLYSTRFFDLETVAVLSILIRVVNMLTTLVTSSAGVIFPYFASGQGDRKQKDKFLWLTTAIAGSLAGFCFALQQPIGLIFLDRELNQHQIWGFGMLCSYVVVHSIYNYIAFNFMMAASLTKLVILTNILIVITFVAFVSFVELSLVSFAAMMSLSAVIGLICLWLLKVWYCVD